MGFGFIVQVFQLKTTKNIFVINKAYIGAVKTFEWEVTKTLSLESSDSEDSKM